MIKFLPLYFLGVSHRTLWKNENIVYRLQISALVPEIFKFEKCVKYANEMTDDVIHSTQNYIICVNRAILANLQRRSLKLCRLIVLYKTHLKLQTILLLWQLTLFQSPPTWFQYVSDFQLKKCYTRPQTQANIFICLLDHVYQAPFANMKIERRGWPEIPLILGRSGTQYVALGIKLFTPNCRAHLLEAYCKEWNISDKNWPRYLFSSYLIKAWLSIWRHH